MARLLGLVALVAACTHAQGVYELPPEEFPKNGVPYVSPEGDVYPSYLERAALTWNGMVCLLCPSLSFSRSYAHTPCALLLLLLLLQ